MTRCWGPGRDTLTGGGDSDTFDGGPDADTNTGEGGRDTFAFAAGDRKLFVVSNGTDSAVFLYASAGADAAVTAGELGPGPMIILNGVDSMELSQLDPANFAFGG